MTSMYGQIAEDSLMNDFNSTNILILIDAEKDKVLQSMNENISYDDSKHFFSDYWKLVISVELTFKRFNKR